MAALTFPRCTTYFYSRPCGRGDEFCKKILDGTIKISTHAPAGGATVGVSFYAPDMIISTHAPAGGATFTPATGAFEADISTHAPAGGATAATWQKDFGRALFLLTPLREGRRDGRPQSAARQSISTHAPAGGATRNGVDRQISRICISTHAPAGGATNPSSLPPSVLENFYSRPCGRGDPRLPCPRPLWAGISTHAPAGGATIEVERATEGRPYFYSRPCGRGDASTPRTPEMDARFLLTPLREGRQQFSTSPS